jgi:hypothetical protein
MGSSPALYYFSDSSWVFRRSLGVDLIIESCHEKVLTLCLFGWMYGACDMQDQPITAVAGLVDTGENVFYGNCAVKPKTSGLGRTAKALFFAFRPCFLIAK